jgi:hypothetical protein
MSPAGQGSVEEGRHAQGGAEPPGELIAEDDGTVEVVARELAGAVRDKRHHIEHAPPRMGALVHAEIEMGDALPGQRPDGAGHLFGAAGQGEDRSVVVRIAMEVEEHRARGDGQMSQNGLVTALADVDNALDGHVASLALVRLQGQPRLRELPGGDGDGL